MKKHYFISSLLAGSSLIAQENVIQATQTNSENIPEETQFITASRSERSSDTVAANVTVIDKEDITKSNARNVAELLKYEAGVIIKKSFNDADKFNIDVRGFGEVSAQNTLILVDGRKINKPDLGGYDLTTIPIYLHTIFFRSRMVLKI